MTTETALITTRSIATRIPPKSGPRTPIRTITTRRTKTETIIRPVRIKNQQQKQ